MAFPNHVNQTSPLAPQEQVLNSAGGYVWQVDDMTQLLRFLCLGSEGGTYYVTEQELKVQNVVCIQRLIEKNEGEKVVAAIKGVSQEGRAVRQGPTLLALALCCRQTTCNLTKKAAYEALPEICRIPTFLFQFVKYCEELSKDGTGWGRAHRRGIANWYLRYGGSANQGGGGDKGEEPMETDGKPKPAGQWQPTIKQLAQHVTKYKQRDGWSHQDLLRLAHPAPKDQGVKALLCYVVKGYKTAKGEYLSDDAPGLVKATFEYLQGVEEMKTVKEARECVELIRRHNLVREHVPTNLLTSTEVWLALLDKMPMTAMIRNLGKMTSMDILNHGQEGAGIVKRKLGSDDTIRSSRIHPFTILIALKIYNQGHGDKGSLKWTPNKEISEALDAAFYKAFKNVQPTGKRFCLCLDVSGSMSWNGCIGCPQITPRDASAAMAMVTLRTEKYCKVMAFSTTIVGIPITRDQKLDEVIHTISSIPMGGTDCGLPMVWATQNKLEFDVFIIYTDSETYAGRIHPSAAIKEYRQKLNIPTAKVIVCGMQANQFSIADPHDKYMMDMAGFDTAAPEVIRGFAMDAF